MKNVTITLDEKTAAWARVHAARRNMSLSRYIGELLHRSMDESGEYERAMRQHLAAKPVRLKAADATYPGREELHERNRIR